MSGRGASRAAKRRFSEGILAVMRASDRMRRSLGAILEPHGVTLQQYNVLRILRGAGEALPTMEIRERMMERAPGITRLVDRLVESGLVERDVPAEDRRRVLCRITDRGLELLRRLDPPMDRADARIFDALSAGEIEGLVGLLARVAAPKGSPSPSRASSGAKGRRRAAGRSGESR